MLIESLAQKTRLAMMTVFAVIGGCTVICAFTVWCCISLVNEVSWVLTETDSRTENSGMYDTDTKAPASFKVSEDLQNNAVT